MRKHTLTHTGIYIRIVPPIEASLSECGKGEEIFDED